MTIILLFQLETTKEFRNVTFPENFQVDDSSCEIHGTDGMNDVPDTIPANVAKQPEPSPSAPEAMIRIVRANPGEITLVALGPLTNLAIATRLCPELPTLVIYINSRLIQFF